MLTAGDAEGARHDEWIAAVPEDWHAGIAHNFDGPEVLTVQSLGLAALFASPLRAAAIAIPPVAFLMLLLADWVSRWRKALGEHVLTAWEEFEQSPVQDVRALKQYVAGVAGLTAGATSFEDIRMNEKLGGISPETMESLQVIFQAEDAEKFGGAAATEQPEVPALARRIHRELGQRTGRRASFSWRR